MTEICFFLGLGIGVIVGVVAGFAAGRVWEKMEKW